MQEHPYSAAQDMSDSEVSQQLSSQTSALHVLTQLTEQLTALEDEGQAPAWRERLLTTLQERMTTIEAELQEIRAALAQLGEREGQS